MHPRDALEDALKRLDEADRIVDLLDRRMPCDLVRELRSQIRLAILRLAVTHPAGVQRARNPDE